MALGPMQCNAGVVGAVAGAPTSLGYVLQLMSSSCDSKKRNHIGPYAKNLEPNSPITILLVLNVGSSECGMIQSITVHPIPPFPTKRTGIPASPFSLVKASHLSQKTGLSFTVFFGTLTSVVLFGGLVGSGIHHRLQSSKSTFTGLDTHGIPLELLTAADSPECTRPTSWRPTEFQWSRERPWNFPRDDLSLYGCIHLWRSCMYLMKTQYRAAERYFT